MEYDTQWAEKYRAYIARPADWLLPICPLRRYGSGLMDKGALAYMKKEDVTRAKPVIYVGIMYQVDDDCERVEYNSMDELLKEWYVD